MILFGMVRNLELVFSQLMRKLKQGGLQLFNMELKNTALKTNWIVRSTSAKNIWVHHAKNMLLWSIPEIWMCNIKKRDIQKIMPPTIWKDIWM